MTDTAVRVASTGLGAQPGPLYLASADWPVFRQRLQNDRLVGLASAAVTTGSLTLDDDSLAELDDLDEQWQSSALAMERTMLDVVADLERHGFEVRVLKGPALAHTVYDEPSWRTFGDIDVLVRGDELTEVRQHLVTHHGAEDPLPALRPGFDAEFGKDVLIRLDGLEIDLHRTLAPGPFGLRIPVTELFDEPQRVELGGTTFPVLAPLPSFLHACYNASLGDVPPRLMSLRDVAQVHTARDLPADTVIDAAGAWGGTAVVAHAVRTTWQTFGLAPCELSDWATAHQPSRLDRRLLAASMSDQRSYTRHIAALAAVPGLAAKWRYGRAVLFPSDEYLAARNWTRGSHIGRAVRRLRPGA